MLERSLKISKSLYTAAEVKKFKEQQIEKQQGIDPILNEPFPKGTICQDHSHTTQHCRAALHLQTNAWEGKVINAYVRCLKWLTDVPLPTLLRNLANYLEVDYSDNPYHNKWMAAVKVQFNKLNSKQQDSVLESLGSTKGTNLKDRKAKFAKVVLDRSLGYDKIVTVINDVKEK